MAENGRRQKFGTIAQDLGLITLEQLYEALKRQGEEVLLGHPRRPIGAVLVEMGLVTGEQVEHLVALQARDGAWRRE